MGFTGYSTAYSSAPNLRGPLCVCVCVCVCECEWDNCQVYDELENIPKSRAHQKLRISYRFKLLSWG